MKFSHTFLHRFFAKALVLTLAGSLFFQPLHADAAKKKRQPTQAELAAAAKIEEERQAAYNKTIDSNQIENWPQGPQIYAESAIVMDAATGTILYNKDMDMRNYPASITKIMTALVALEHASLDEVVTYSYYATHSIEAGSSSIGTTEGEELTVEQSLYALLLSSANECGNGLAEHISGSIDGFVDLMNEKAAELGCTNTHFANPHGLHDENHYTSAHDMALIMQAALQNEDFVRISGTAKYNMPPTNKDTEITYMTNHHYMIAPYNGVTKYLDDTVIAGKTGYTSDALNTLVTAAERNGMTLIVVTMRTQGTSEKGVPLFPDTALLLDYATNNFTKVNVAANETSFSMDNSTFFRTGSEIFGQAKPLIEIDKSDSVILPNGVDFSEVSPELTFQDDSSDTVATLSYTYQGQSVGSASIRLAKSNVQEFNFQKESGDEETKETAPKRFIKINVRFILTFAIIGAVAFFLYFFLKRLCRSFQLTFSLPKLNIRPKRRRRPRKRQQLAMPFRDFQRPKNKGRYRRKPKKRSSFHSDLDL